MFFFKKKKKKNTELEDSFIRVVDEINNLDDEGNPRKIEHFVLDSCEHIIATAKEMEAGKNQYALLSDYLSDVEKIRKIDPKTRENIMDYSENIYRLTKRKNDYKESDKRIEDDTFMLLNEHESSIVDDIERMSENEKYKDKVSAEIRTLESEKSRWEIEKDELLELISKLRIVQLVVFVFIAIIAVAFLAFPRELVNSIRMPLLVILFIGVLAGFGLYILIGEKRKEYRVAIKKLNQNITLLNVERMRFVNISKALQYEMEIYDVTSSGELLYLWEQYLLTVKEVEAYRKNNLDLQYYLDRLYKVLKSFGLKYEKKWLEQVDVLIDEEKILNLRLRLMERRAVTKAQIEESDRMISEERAEIDRLMREHDFYVGEVLEIISNVDKFCAETRRAIKENHIL